MVIVAVLAAAVGLAYGRLPSAVAVRVFGEPREPLLVHTDFTRPLRDLGPASARVAVVQVLTGGLFGAPAVVVGAEWVLPAYLWFVAVTLVLTLTDLDRKLIPNRILFPSSAFAAALLAIGALLDGSFTDLGRAAAAAGILFLSLLVIALAARGGFGMGDVKLGALLGLFLGYIGWETLVVGGVGAFLLGGVVSLLLLALRIKGRKDAIPFGPYLVLASWIAIAASDEIVDWWQG